MLNVPFHADLLLRNPKQQPIKQNIQKINPNINFDFEENSPFQEGIISETFHRLDKSFFHNPKELGDLIKKENLVHKVLPKQTDIDKILEIIQRKVLKGMHLPVEVKEIQAGYLHRPYFKELYLYLLQNKLRSSKSAIRKFRNIVRKICLIRFTIVQNITRKRDSSSSNTRNMCGQDNNPISQKFICRTPRSN